MKTVFLALVLASTLAACAVYTPSGAVIVDPGARVSHGHGGGFCPPGQAKKGNC